MKKYSLLTIVFALIISAICTSCTHFPQTSQYNERLGGSKPKMLGTPRTGSIGHYTYSVYQNGVHLISKSGTIYPNEIFAYNISSSHEDTVYARTGNKWDYGMINRNRLGKGITTAPDTLESDVIYTYIILARNARAAADKYSYEQKQKTSQESVTAPQPRKFSSTKIYSGPTFKEW